MNQLKLIIMAKFYVIECSNFGYMIIDSEELIEMKNDGESPYILKKFDDIEDATNYLDELEGKLMQGRCMCGDEL